MQPEDAVRVRHMIEAAEAVQSFIAGRRRIDLDSDRMLLFALVRAIEIIGEAASKLSPEARAGWLDEVERTVWERLRPAQLPLPAYK